MSHRRFVAVLPLALLVVTACKRVSPEESKAPVRTDPSVVELTTQQAASAVLKTGMLESREASSTLRLPGALSVDPRRSWTVAPVVEGVVESVAVAANDTVRKGQALARLRSSALGDAQVAWLEARANLRIATASRDRNAGLRQQAVVSEARWLEVDAGFQRAQVALAQASHKLGMAGMSTQELGALESDGRSFGEMTLASPGSGIVLSAVAARGQALAAGEKAFELADLSELWATIHVPVASLDQVRQGATAMIRVADRPERGWPGTIQSLGGAVDPADQTAEARIVVLNDDAFLRPGMFVEVEVAGVPLRALMVPSSAVFNVGNQAYVFQKIGDSRFKGLAVVARPPVGDWTPVSGAGVEEGIEVVTGGTAELKSHWLYEGGE